MFHVDHKEPRDEAICEGLLGLLPNIPISDVASLNLSG